MNRRIYRSLTAVVLILAAVILACGQIAADFGLRLLPEKYLCKWILGSACGPFPAENFSLFFGHSYEAWVLFFSAAVIFLHPFQKEDFEVRFGRFRTALTAFAFFLSLHFAVSAVILRSFTGGPMLITLSFVSAALVSYLPPRFSFNLRQDTSALLKPLLAAGLLFVIISGYQQQQLRLKLEFGSEKIEEIVERWKNAPASLTNISAGTELNEAASSSAPHHLVVFADLECQPCLKGLGSLLELDEEFGRQVKATMINFPLSKECNPGMRFDLHPSACDFASYLIENPGDKAIELIKRRSDYPWEKSTDVLKDYPGYKSGSKSAELIESQIKAGKAAGVRSTPAFFLDGKRLDVMKDKSKLPLLVKRALEN